MADYDTGSNVDTEPQVPSLIQLSDDEESEEDEEARLGNLTWKINNFHDRGLSHENLSLILGLREARWGNRTFLGFPGPGICEALEAFFDCLAFKERSVTTSWHVDCMMNDHLKHFLSRERRDRPRPNPPVQHNYLVMLVDWMVEVSVGWRLKSQTIHRAVVYVARYLSQAQGVVESHSIQLVGTTCLMLACKLEEVRQESIVRFSRITGSTYTTHQIEAMEHQITTVLNFRMSDVTICDFVLIYAEKMMGITCAPCLRLSRVLSEVALHSLPLVVSVPSLVAMAVIYIAVHLTQGDFENYWAPWMREYFPHTPEELQECVDSLLTLWEGYRSETLASDQLRYIYNAQLNSMDLSAAEIPPVNA
eukprot:TRINITY_DN9061_c0_g1_i1.p1 TRINITY_DN9061_c0_g1~~TRINITY_DN9061_c0_g1_i1.p1  ORF type:complete len:364 (+),score=85.98 TRINITY_DN9061_c0_g1_i1:129-1220(+)